MCALRIVCTPPTKMVLQSSICCDDNGASDVSGYKLDLQ